MTVPVASPLAQIGHALGRVVAELPVVVFTLDRHLIYTLFEGAAVARLGVRAGDLVGASAEERHPSDGELLHAMRRALAGDITSAPMRLGDVALSVRLAPVRDSEGQVVGVMGMSVDVSTDARFDGAVERYDASFRRLADATPDGVFLQRGSTLVLANPVFVAVLGCQSEHELVGRSVEELVHPEDRAEVRARSAAAEANGSVPPAEIRFVRSDGSVVTLETSKVMVEFAGTRHTLVLARDLTPRKRMQQRFMQADRLAAVGRLAAGVAHEINNPLTYILMNLEGIGRRLTALRELSRVAEHGELAQACEQHFNAAAELIEIARKGVERIVEVVSALKTFGIRTTQRRAIVDVRTVLDATIRVSWSEIRHRARLVRNYHDVAPVEADESRLAQVFSSILMNAAQSIGSNGADTNYIQIDVQPDGPGHVVVQVSDTGAGIERSVLPRIFDPFFTTKPTGIGLGLSISYGIVTELGGEIAVESDPGEGTVVRVRLPAYAGRSSWPGPAADHGDETHGAPKKRILVIDDDAAIGDALELALAPDYEVVPITNGRDAIVRLEAHELFEAILCDLTMSALSGAELFETIRRRWPELEKRFVFMGGGAFTPRALELISNLRNVRVEKKPINVAHMRVLLDAIVRESRAAAERSSRPPRA